MSKWGKAKVLHQKAEIYTDIVLHWLESRGYSFAAVVVAVVLLLALGQCSGS